MSENIFVVRMYVKRTMSLKKQKEFF